MSLPALPDIFGNYALGDFNEVVAPPAIDWLPQTPGWAIVGLLILAVLARKGWHWLQHWYRNRYRREARQRLQQLGDTDALVVEVNRLLKLAALAAFDREQAASLSGYEWTGFLNGRCEQAPFDSSLCELLALGVYTGKAVDQATGRRLLKASLAWIDLHKNRFDD